MPARPREPEVGQRNRRLGVMLLGILLALYAGSVLFVLIRH
jgi:hypothetical protein